MRGLWIVAPGRENSFAIRAETQEDVADGTSDSILLVYEGQD